jgi:prepilin-type N-terminal cleavage/methylation domain-containing protein
MKSQHYTGFTLAEVLITLGIIGVVAAMTIPTLMNNTQENEYHVAAKKVYTILSQATMNMLNTNGGTIWDNSSADYKQLSLNMKDTYKAHLKYVKEGTLTDISTTGWYGYKSNSIAMDDGGNSDRYALELNDGMILRFFATQDCSSGTVIAGTSNCGDILVDVNGIKKPNMFGKDVYVFSVFKTSDGAYKLVPSGVHTTGYTCEANTTVTTRCFGCTELVLNGQDLP